MGYLANYMVRRIARELDDREVVVWWDPDRVWTAWLQKASGASDLSSQQARELDFEGRSVQLLTFNGSYTEILDISEELLASDSVSHLLVYLPGERHYEKLSPLRELECFGGNREPFYRDLARTARQAFKGAGLADTRIDELLSSGSITFEYLDEIEFGEGQGTVSPLAPIFGSGREEDVFVGFLAREQLRVEVVEHGLLGHVRRLAERSLGIELEPSDDPETLAQQLSRVLLVGELRSDLGEPDPLEISQIPQVAEEEAVARIRTICRRLRSVEPEAYIHLAGKVEEDLGLAAAEIDPLNLGTIDTFSFEERALLSRCARMLGSGEIDAARQLADERASSFWTSVQRFPERRAEWRVLDELGKLALLDGAIERELSSGIGSAHAFLDAYTQADGWHRADRSFRDARAGLSRLGDAQPIEATAQSVLARHDELVDRTTRQFISELKDSGWDIEGTLRQRQIFDERVRQGNGVMAVILADALRFEMGAELARILESSGATSVQLDHAVAEVPTITRVGMAALLPEASGSFEIANDNKGVLGVVDGTPLRSARDRMEQARALCPGLVEMTMDDVVYETPPKRLREKLERAPVIIVRSIEIDAAGENLPTGLARRIMGSVLEDIRKTVLRLATAGVSRFLVVADHGHLFSARRDDDMKIDAPSGGEQIDLHRRCWVGRGASTPPGCVRVSLRDFGYTSDLDLITPKGTGVFKAGGDLAYHHGGLSLQELVIPVLSFELTVAKEGRDNRSGIILSSASDKVTNRIFSLSIERSELALEPLRMKVLALGPDGRVVGQAMHATAGWDAEGKVLTLADQEPVSVAVQLDDDTVDELRVVAVEVGTDRTIKDTAPLPVQLLR